MEKSVLVASKPYMYLTLSDTEDTEWDRDKLAVEVGTVVKVSATACAGTSDSGVGIGSPCACETTYCTVHLSGAYACVDANSIDTEVLRIDGKDCTIEATDSLIIGANMECTRSSEYPVDRPNANSGKGLTHYS